MALIFMESFDKYGPANSNTTGVGNLLTAGEWTSNTLNWNVVAPLSTTGQAISANFGATTGLVKTLPASYSRLVGGFRFSSNLAGSSPSGILFSDAGTAQCSITVAAPTGVINLRNGTFSGTIIATGSSVSAGTTHYLEWDITFGNSANFQCWLDGVSLFSGTADTTATANNTANGIIFGGQAGGSQIITIDDLYLFDTTGSTNNAVLLTSPRIETSFPTSDSAAQFGFGAGILGTSVARTTAGSAGNANFLQLRPFTPSVNCTLNSVSLVSAQTSAPALLRPLVYADSAGVAGTLLSTGSTQTGVTSGVTKTLPLTTPQSLTAGARYWLGFMSDTTFNLNSVDGSNGGYRASATFASGAPGTAPALTAGQGTFLFWGDLTGVAVNNYEVNQQPPPGINSYVLDSTVGHEDLYGMTALSATPANVHAVAVKAYVAKSDTGARTVSMRMKSGATDSGGSATGQAPGTSFGWMASYFPNDPATASSWSVAALNAATAGVRVDS